MSGAGPVAPRAALHPMTIIQREGVGYTVTPWQPPVEGWTMLGEPQRFATIEEAHTASSALTGKHQGATAILIFPPNYRAPQFRGRS